jgi:hypothetical protein
MEALVPAFLLAILCLAGDQLTLIVARLGGRAAAVAALGHAVPCVLAGLAALAMTPLMPPRAQTLFLAVALVVSGLALLWPAAGAPRLLDGRLGALPTALLAGAGLGASGAVPLFVLALGLGGHPWLAVAGGALGALAVLTLAALTGSRQWAALPHNWLRKAAAMVLLVAGAANTVSAAGIG